MNVTVYQIYYDIAQLSFLDKSFIPYDNTSNLNREWAEYHIFEKEYAEMTHQKQDYTGFFSWKYLQKSRIPGNRFLEFIQKNPAFDVYFLNPFPMEEYLFENVWMQGELFHKGILDFSQRILERMGYSVDLRQWKQDRMSFAFCNYWVGNQKFWDQYMAFTGKFAQMLRTGLSDSEKKFLHSIASRQNHFSYVAFIMERLFSTFVYLEKANLRALRYEYSDEEIRIRYPGKKLWIWNILKSRFPFLGTLRAVVRKLVKLTRKRDF